MAHSLALRLSHIPSVWAVLGVLDVGGIGPEIDVGGDADFLHRKVGTYRCYSIQYALAVVIDAERNCAIRSAKRN